MVSEFRTYVLKRQDLFDTAPEGVEYITHSYEMDGHKFIMKALKIGEYPFYANYTIQHPNAKCQCECMEGIIQPFDSKVKKARFYEKSACFEETWRKICNLFDAEIFTSLDDNEFIERIVERMSCF